MTITTIVAENSNNPTEVQDWFDNNPNVAIIAIWNAGAVFYIISQ